MNKPLVLWIPNSARDSKAFGDRLSQLGFSLVTCAGRGDVDKLKQEARVLLVDLDLPLSDIEAFLAYRRKADPQAKVTFFGYYHASHDGDQPKLELGPISRIYPVRRVFSIPFQEEALFQAIQGRCQKTTKKRKRILVIDDSPTQLALTIKSLSEFYNVITASTGQEGLRLSMMEEPDLILLDLNMPDTNGLKVCADLKSFYPTDQTPIIAYTASGDMDLIKKSMLVGATDYVIKEADDASLIKKIEQFLKSNYTEIGNHE